MPSHQYLIERLRATRAHIADRLERIRRDRRHVDGVSPDFAEQAVERENDEVLENLETATEADLRQIDRALRRVDAGLYPTCERCGERIDMQRLRAMPHATLCRRCVARGETTELLEKRSRHAG